MFDPYHPLTQSIDKSITQSIYLSIYLHLVKPGERIGAFHMICGSEGVTKPVRSQLKIIIRSMYSNPPAHGAFIVAVVLSTPELYEEWY